MWPCTMGRERWTTLQYNARYLQGNERAGMTNVNRTVRLRATQRKNKVTSCTALFDTYVAYALQCNCSSK